MQKFFLDKVGILSINEYLPSYEGEIYCEDPRCRIPIKYIPRTQKKRAYFKEKSPYKHKEICGARSKNPKSTTDSSRIKKIKAYNRKEELPPVLSLSPEVGMSGIMAASDPVNKLSKEAKYVVISHASGKKRRYLRSLFAIAKYIKSNFETRNALRFNVGKTIVGFDDIIHEPSYLLSEADHLISSKEKVYVYGEIKEIEVHQHFSLCHSQTIDFTGIIGDFKSVSNSEFFKAFARHLFLLKSEGKRVRNEKKLLCKINSLYEERLPH